MLDSGGMREQMIDLAEGYGVEFAQISSITTAVLRENLETGLEAVNPMDVVLYVNFVYKSQGSGPCDPCTGE